MSKIWEQAMRQSMSFCDIARHHATPKEIEESWHRAFSCAAKSIGINKAAMEILWHHLAEGNWERLNLTDEEFKRTSDDWLDSLREDVWYCSDRWSLDRLTRCHWKFRQYMYAVQKEAGVEV